MDHWFLRLAKNKKMDHQILDYVHKRYDDDDIVVYPCLLLLVTTILAETQLLNFCECLLLVNRNDDTVSHVTY